MVLHPQDDHPNELVPPLTTHAQAVHPSSSPEDTDESSPEAAISIDDEVESDTALFEP